MIIIMSMKQPKKTLLSYRLMQTNMQQEGIPGQDRTKQTNRATTTSKKKKWKEESQEKRSEAQKKKKKEI